MNSSVGDSDAEPAASLANVGPRPLTFVRRKRTPRVSSGQIEALLAKLEARPFLFTRKFTGLQGRENFETGWKEVADELNQLPNGSIKTPEQWMTVWRDFKSRACTKAAKLKRERVQTGNRPITTAPLTEVERKIISLLGVEYTFGTDCPDTMPEEDTLQHEMEAGGVIDEVICLPTQCNELQLIVAESEEAPQITSGSRATAAVSPPPTEEATLQLSAQQIRVRRNRTPAVGTQPPTSQYRRNRNLNPRRSVAEQHNLARQDFLAVAQSNAESMSMLAAATQLQAEAAKMHAEAAKVQAEALILFAQAANKVGDALQTFINKNNT